MASKKHRYELDQESSLFNTSRIHCHSAPDFLALEKESSHRFKLEEMKARDYLNVPEEIRIFGLGRSHTPPPQAQYSKVSERIRQIGSSSPTIHRFQCGTFCGGKGCKYENPLRWGKEKGVAFNGIFSHWITDCIVAMARPSTLLFTDYNLLEQLKENGINAVINLQTPGEHAHCGPGLEESGFTYIPEYLMKNDIYFYNYRWPDYGTSSLENILDVVKVIDFSCSNGRVAIHCHAGLGRTGAAIACYLLYSERMPPEDAIVRVREKRPDSIQTRGQLELINQFSLYLLSLWTLYPCLSSSLNLCQYVERQAKLIHGEELERYKHIPKVIDVLCSRLKELGENGSFKYHGYNHENSFEDMSREGEENWLVVSYSSSELTDSIESTCYQDDDHLIQSLLGTSQCCHSGGFQSRLVSLKNEINNQWVWNDLAQESDPTVLFSLLFTFLSHLKEPVISLTSCYHTNFIELLSKNEKAVLLAILDAVKSVIPLCHIITYFSAITIHLIKFFCHCSSQQIEDNSTTSNHLLHYIMEYFQ